MKKWLWLIVMLMVAGQTWAQGTNQTQTKSLTIKVVSRLQISTTSLPAAVVGSPYAQTLTALGGVVPYTWTATGLPTWLAITTNPDSTGKLAGTVPDAACPPGPVCPFTFTVTATDSTGQISQIEIDTGLLVAWTGVWILDQPLFDGLP